MHTTKPRIGCTPLTETGWWVTDVADYPQYAKYEGGMKVVRLNWKNPEHCEAPVIIRAPDESRAGEILRLFVGGFSLGSSSQATKFLKACRVSDGYVEGFNKTARGGRRTMVWQRWADVGAVPNYLSKSQALRCVAKRLIELGLHAYSTHEEYDHDEHFDALAIGSAVHALEYERAVAKIPCEAIRVYLLGNRYESGMGRLPKARDDGGYDYFFTHHSYHDEWGYIIADESDPKGFRTVHTHGGDIGD